MIALAEKAEEHKIIAPQFSKMFADFGGIH